MDPARNAPLGTHVHLREDGFYFSQGPARPDLAAQNLINIETILSKNIPYSKAKLKQEKQAGRVINNAEIINNNLMEAAKSNKELLLQNFSSEKGLDRVWSNITGKEREVTKLFQRIELLNTDYRPFSHEQETLLHETERMGWLAKYPSDNYRTRNSHPANLYDSIDFHNEGKNVFNDLVREGIIDKSDLVLTKSDKSTPSGSVQDIDLLKTIHTVQDKFFDKKLSKENLLKLEKLRDAYLNEDNSSKIELIGLLYGFGTEVFDTHLINVAKKNHATKSLEVLQRYQANSVKIAKELGWKGEDIDALSFICHLKETLKDLQKSNLLQNRLGLNEITSFSLRDHNLLKTISLVKHDLQNLDYSERKKLEKICFDKTKEYVEKGNFRGILILRLLFGIVNWYDEINSFNDITENLNDYVDVTIQREILSFYVNRVPVEYIFKLSSPKTIKLLLDHHFIDVEKAGNQLFYRIYYDIATAFDNVIDSWKSVLDKLSELGFDFNQFTIHDAPLAFHLFKTIKKNKEFFNYLVEKKINLEAKNLKGLTLLSETLRGFLPQAENILFLLNQGVKVNYKDPLGSSPLSLSIKLLSENPHGNEKKLWLNVVKKMIDAGANINESSTEIVDLFQRGSGFFWAGNLLEWGLDPDAKGSDGKSLMDIAVEANWLSIANQLINAGAAINSEQKAILLNKAIEYENSEMIALLKTDKLP